MYKAKTNTFKLNIVEIGSPIIEIKQAFAIDLENVEVFKDEFENLIDKYKVKGVL